MVRRKSLAELKEEFIDLRNDKVVYDKGPTDSNVYINLLIKYYAVVQRIKAIEARVLVCLLLLIMAGCNAGKGAGTMIRGIGTDVEQLNQGYMDRHGR